MNIWRVALSRQSVCEQHGLNSLVCSGNCQVGQSETGSGYRRTGCEPEIIEFGKNACLTVEDKSEPGDKEFQEGTELLFGLRLGLKFHFKEKGKGLSVPRLECQLWSESGKPIYKIGRTEWIWKLMPKATDYVTAVLVTSATETVTKNGLRPESPLR